VSKLGFWSGLGPDASRASVLGSQAQNAAGTKAIGGQGQVGRAGWLSGASRHLLVKVRLAKGKRLSGVGFDGPRNNAATFYLWWAAPDPGLRVSREGSSA
jgi:hypothetical protein